MKAVISLLFCAVVLSLTACSAPVTGDGPQVAKFTILENKTLDQEETAEEPNIVKEESPVPQKVEGDSQSKEEFRLKGGEEITFKGVAVKVGQITPEARFLVSVDDVTYIITETKYEELIKGLLVMVKDFVYNKTHHEESFVVLKVKGPDLGPDDYIFLGEDRKVIMGDNFKVTTFEPKQKLIELLVADSFVVRLKEGDSKMVGVYNLTNLRTFPRDKRFESSAIIRVLVQNNQQ